MGWGGVGRGGAVLEGLRRWGGEVVGWGGGRVGAMLCRHAEGRA